MVQTSVKPETLYPDSDGKPMAENTEQYRWITKLVTNLKHLLRDQVAFVAGDLLWYPVQVPAGQQPPRQAPDVMVALGRPQQRRGSYKQWEEAGVAPQVVFEIISPSNTFVEMAGKQQFYQRYGAEEIYFYDPQAKSFWGCVYQNNAWEFIANLDSPWTSPLLGIHFEMLAEGLAVFHPDGKPFKTLVELVDERDAATAERDTAQAERDAAQTERDVAQAKLERAIAKLKVAGLDPNDL